MRHNLNSVKKTFAKKILEWYNEHKRDLPWRQSKNPYLIWLSEIMLQQTRVAQGLPYFEKFRERYPTVTALARAPQDEVYAMWQGLGYYARVRHMMETAKVITNEYYGDFPKNYVDLLKLKGIGRYTAAAIASMAYNQPVPVLDGNVQRVICRIILFEEDVRVARNQTFLFEIAGKLLDTENPGQYNQAIMEFGALHCTPKKPKCASCPVQNLCEAYPLGIQQELPFKSKPKPLKNRYFTYLAITDEEGNLYLKKRNTPDIWQNLYDFFSIEKDCLIRAPEDVLQALRALGINSTNSVVLGHSREYVQKLSHVAVHAIFWKILLKNVSDYFIEKHNFLVLRQSNISDVAKPLIVNRYIADNFTQIL